MLPEEQYASKVTKNKTLLLMPNPLKHPSSKQYPNSAQKKGNKKMKPILLLTLLLAIQTQAADTYAPKLKPYAPQNQFTSKDYFNWGGSIIQGPTGRYHLFYSRWQKKHTFLAWLTHSEIAVATSKNPHGPWTYKYTALKGRSKNHWDAINAHNTQNKILQRQILPLLHFIKSQTFPHKTAAHPNRERGGTATKTGNPSETISAPE